MRLAHVVMAAAALALPAASACADTLTGPTPSRR